MSSPARVEGYDTPAQQREDSTTFMVAKVSSPNEKLVLSSSCSLEEICNLSTLQEKDRPTSMTMDSENTHETCLRHRLDSGLGS